MRLSWLVAIASVLIAAMLGAPAHAQGTKHQTISFNGLGNTALDGTPSTPTATAPGGTVTFASANAYYCDIASDGVSIIMNHVGTCTINASQAGNATYAAAATAQQSFQISQGGSIIKYPTNDITYDLIPYNLHASQSSGLPLHYSAPPIGFSFNWFGNWFIANVCSVDPVTGVVTAVGTGNCYIHITGDGSADSRAPTDGVFNFKINNGNPSIAFPAPNNTSTNYAPPTLNAKVVPAGDNAIISYALNQPSPACKVTKGGIVSWAKDANNVLAGGTCSITASAPSAPNYNAPQDATVSFTVQNSLNTITFPPMQDTAYNAPSPVPAATASSGLAVTYSSLTTSICKVTASGTITFVPPITGQCTIQADQAGNTTTGPALSATQSFNVTAEANIITLSFPASLTLAGTPASVSVVATTTTSTSPALPVILKSTTPTVCGISPTNANTVVATAVGRCSITASATAGGKYADAAPVSAYFQVIGEDNLITFPPFNPSTVQISGAAPKLTATASGSPLTYVSNNTKACTLATDTATPPATTITLVAPGTCSITASQGGDSTHVAAKPVTQAFTITPTITPGVNTITFNTITPPTSAGFPYASTPPLLSAYASSGLPVSYALTVTTPATTYGCTVTPTGAIAFVSAGTCQITASQAGNASFPAATPVTQSFNILGTANTITFNQPVDTSFTSTPPVLAATATSGQPVTYASNSTGVCTLSTNTATPPVTSIAFVAVGSCQITASSAGYQGNLPATSVTKQFNIKPGVNTITFPALPNTLTTATPPTPAATTSALPAASFPIAYSSTSSSVCMVAPSGVITFVAAGSCSITASQAGGGNYASATSVTRAFNFTTTANVISFGPISPPSPQGFAFTDAPPTLGATAASSLPVTYASNSPNVCTVSGGAITFVAGGTCSITASQPGNTTYAAASPVTQTFSILSGTKPNAITFPALGTVSMTGPAPVPAATSSSGLPVTYTTATTSFCSVSAGGTVTLVSPGTCTILASQNGNATYGAAAPQSGDLIITAATNTIAFTQFTPPGQTAFALASTPPVLTASTSSGLPVVYSSATPTLCTVTSAGALRFVTAGPCSITATQPGNATYAAATPQTVTFAITPNANTITFPQPADILFSANSRTLSAVATSGQPPNLTSTTPGVCTVTAPGSSPATVILVSAGQCSITASQAASVTYVAATPMTVSFNVTAQGNSITFKAPPDSALNATPPVLGGSASSGLPVVYSSATTSVCTVTPAGVMTFKTAGQCSITANQPGSAIYAVAAPMTVSFAVTLIPNAITFPKPADSLLSAGLLSVSAVATSGQPVSYASTTPTVCSVTPSGAVTPLGTTPGTVTLMAAGVCSITASQAASATYAAATSVTVSFNVTTSANVITFPVPPNTPFTSTPPTLKATASSGLAVFYSSNATGLCTVTQAGVLTFVAGGQCSITAAQAGTPAISPAASVTQVFTVTPGANVVTFPQPADTPFTTAPPTLTATASSKLAVSYVSTSAAVCTVTLAGAIKFVAGGTCSITASQAGNASYAVATPVTTSFLVTGGANAITFTKPADTPFTSSPPALTATAGSGLPVNYASTTTTICTVTTGGAIVFKQGGVCTITAAQPGNASFTPATSVTQSFQVLPGVNIITFGPLSGVIASAPPPVPTATASSGLAVNYVSLTAAACSVTPAGVITLNAVGTCTIQAQQGGNVSYAAAANVPQSFTIDKNPTVIVVKNAAKVEAQPQAVSPPISAPISTLTASTLTPFLGQPVTLSSTVIPTPSGGTVTFNDGTAVLCNQVTLAVATATCTIAFHTAGDHTLTATYSGNAAFATSTSPPIVVSVVDQRKATSQVIAGFMNRRNDLIAANAPDTNRQIDRLVEAGGPASGGSITSGFSSAMPAASSTLGSSIADHPNLGDDSSNFGRPSLGRRGVSATRNITDFPGNAFNNATAADAGGLSGGSLPLKVTGNTDGAMLLGFSTSLSELRRHASEADARKLALAGEGAATQPANRSTFHPFDIWVSGTYANFRDPTFGTTQDGHFAMLTVGADYVVNPSLLVGLLVQFDDTTQKTSSTAGSASGRGWMVGPYATVRLSENVFWQSRAAWGSSSNTVSPFLTYTDSFSSDRWLAATSLTGRFVSGPWMFKPTASVSYIEDMSNSYADTYGITIPQVSARLGQAKIGPEIGYGFKVGSYMVQPHAGLQVIWNFAHDASAAGLGSLDGQPAGSTSVRGRAEFGLRVTDPTGMSFGANGSYDGIGAKGFEAISGGASLRVPLN